MKCLWCTDDNPIFESRMDSPCSFPCVAKASKEDERKRIIAKARERASRFPYFPHGDALRNFANELEAEDG